ncbi:ABC transporter substrate-binding protein [Psychrobacter sp. SWN149]|uniref:ABC transporter substrate-binding protein n=1 Tax=Psychrobacter sp. SWN149 TaxID=2792057 RepID=UPI0018CE1B9E|nr:ABC transporter substrate-binding protein [Psychrobacter sp. SWN149]MBH0006626.1 ABC transporter substrate-binding protein [Psychrobacter sp. SWN149]
MPPIFYTEQSSKRSIDTPKPVSVTSLTTLKWFALSLCLILTACNNQTSTQNSTDQLDELPSSITSAAEKSDSDRINIASPDWGNAATLTAMGHAPIATGDIRVWDRWVGNPKLPSSTVDLGIRYQPNAELIAQLPVDMVIDNYFYEHARNLYGDVPAESVMSAAKGETATWADYTEPTRELGALIDNPKMAEDYIAQSQKDIQLASQQLQQRYPRVKKFAVVQFADANNMRMYVANSLFQPALEQMGKELVVLGKGNNWGFVPVRMGDLAQLDDETCLLIIDPLSPITRAEIDDSLIWQRLGYGNTRCVGELPPVWIYGGMSSLVSLANNLSDVSLKGGDVL